MHVFVPIILFVVFILTACNPHNESTVVYYDTAVGDVNIPNSKGTSTTTKRETPNIEIGNVNINRDSLVSFAKSLTGVPYKYASTDPSQGFDCSGFITYVFNRFQVKVPRSSVDFTNVGKEVKLPEAKKGDLILFTGTDSLVRIVGHMGIVTSNDDTLRFVHSTSGKAYGVTETPLNKYYLGRFVKIVDIF